MQIKLMQIDQQAMLPARRYFKVTDWINGRTRYPGVLQRFRLADST